MEPGGHSDELDWKKTVKKWVDLEMKPRFLEPSVRFPSLWPP